MHDTLDPNEQDPESRANSRPLDNIEDWIKIEFDPVERAGIRFIAQKAVKPELQRVLPQMVEDEVKRVLQAREGT